MSTTYSLAIQVSVWKEHCCAGCGASYRYLFKRKKTGQGGTPKAAEKAAHAAVVAALANEVDMQPCPGCGLYQPDMIAARRKRRHWYVFLAGLAAFSPILLLVAMDVIALSTASWLAACAAGVLALAHLYVDLPNPNADLAANHALARRRAEAGDLWVPEGGKPEEGREVGRGVSGGQWLCHLLLGAAVLVLLAPPGLRRANGMQDNPEWHPEVAGPGDEAYLYFPVHINCVKGLWNGAPTVTLLNPEELGRPGPPPVIAATSNTGNWGGSISVKSSEKNSSPALWARVHLPNDPNLAGKTLRLQIDMDVRYPSMVGDKAFAQKQERYGHTALLRVSGYGAGKTWLTTWWVCFLAGVSVALACGALLAVLSGGFRKQALPTRIFVPERPGEENKEDAEDDEERR